MAAELTVTGPTPRSKNHVPKCGASWYTGNSSYYGGRAITISGFSEPAGGRRVVIDLSPDECIRLARALLESSVSYEEFAKYRARIPATS